MKPRVQSARADFVQVKRPSSAVTRDEHRTIRTLYDVREGERAWRPRSPAATRDHPRRVKPRARG